MVPQQPSAIFWALQFFLVPGTFSIAARELSRYTTEATYSMKYLFMHFIYIYLEKIDVVLNK